MNSGFLFLFACLAISISSGQVRNSSTERAVAALRDHRPEIAISLLEPLTKAEPGDYKARALLGIALSVSGKNEDAVRELTEALQVHPSYPPALKALAACEMNLRRYGSAKKHFEQLLAVAPHDPVANAGLGDIAFMDSRFKDAVEHFERSGSLYRQDAKLLLEYAKANVQLGQTAKANEALASLPEDVDASVHFEAGSLLASSRQYDLAARQFELALPRYPDPYAAGFNLVLARMNEHKFREAIDAGKTLIANGQQKAELLNLMAEAYEKLGDTKRAYDSLRTATLLEPLEEANYVDLITLCTEHTNYDLAAEIAGIGLGKLPSSERLHVQLGVVMAMKARLVEASEQFEIAAKLVPDRSLPYVALALVSMQMNKPQEAVTRLRGRLREVPEDYLALWFLGEGLDRSGAAPGSAGENEAIRALERSVKIRPDISQSQELLGKLLAREGRLDESALHLERAIALDPANVSAIYQLAQVCNRKGDIPRAKELFAKVSKLKRDDRENFTRRGLQQILRADPKT